MRFKFPNSIIGDRHERCGSVALLNAIATVTIFAALVSDSWIILHPRPSYRGGANTLSINGTHRKQFESFAFTPNIFPNGKYCNTVGALRFWHSTRFGTFFDARGYQHVTYHYRNTVVIDCITQTIANFFFVIISFSCIGMTLSLWASLLALFAPPHKFLIFLRQNTVFEFLNLFLVSLALIASVVIHWHIDSMHPEAVVTIGTGMYSVLITIFLMFLSLGTSFWHRRHLRRIRHVKNKQYICSRALRSWRDYSRRSPENRMIVGVNEAFVPDEPVLNFTPQRESDPDTPSDTVAPLSSVPPPAFPQT